MMITVGWGEEWRRSRGGEEKGWGGGEGEGREEKGGEQEESGRGGGEGERRDEKGRGRRQEERDEKGRGRRQEERA